MFSKLKFGRKPTLTFGLDIGSSAVKVVQLVAGEGGTLSLAGLGIVTLPPETVVDGSIKDPATVSAAIKEAVEKSGATGVDAAISLCGRELIIKKVQIPAVPPKELAAAVQLEAEHHIPFAIEEVFIDYHVVGQVENNLDLILVAVKKTKVMEYVTVVEQAGFNPLIVDVDSFALSNQFELGAGEPGEEAVALIDIGASVMKTNVMQHGASIFARDIPFGGIQYTQAIASRLGVAYDQAETAKLGKDPAVDWDTLSPAVEEVSHELSLEVQRTFDYFASTAESERIGKIVLSGGCAQVPGLPDYLASNWGIPVELARPFERIAVTDAHAEEINAAGPALAVAVGLGLRKAGDKAQ